MGAMHDEAPGLDRREAATPARTQSAARRLEHQRVGGLRADGERDQVTDQAFVRGLEKMDVDDPASTRVLGYAGGAC